MFGRRNESVSRTRWAAIGAAVAVSLGAGGLGWIAHAANTAPSTFVGIAPCRLFDTRPAPDNVGDRNTPLAAGEEFVRQVTGTNGNCTIPANATAIAYNLTVPTSISGFLTIFPADATRPTSSSINPVAGESVKANGGIVGLSPAGAIKLYTLSGPLNAILDITGYYTAAGGAQSDVIPSGKTVTGEIIYDGHASGTVQGDRASAQLPGIAPVALTGNTVNFASGASDNDATCTGTVAAPTAPAGKVCIYLQAATTGIAPSSISGGAGLLPTRAFWITFVASTTGDNVDELLYATWAYTAP
ncbi:MAG: hypothetical protein JWN99_749 [Ilumatobacteraceae bacterium]|nr:hypothetical protein [Ilumatobacteraceae bacterium]